MTLKLLFCFLLLGHISASYGQSYLLVIPNSFDPEDDLKVYVQMLSPVSYETIEGKLLDDENKTVGTGILSLNSGNQDGVLTIKVSKPEKDNYRQRLLIKGSGMISFTNETTLDTSHSTKSQSPHIFIQTDKATYKTGQKVLYRVFAVDDELRPVNDNFNITIRDPKGIRIEERRNVSEKMGISGELQLSEYPNLGSWDIIVTSEIEPNRQISERQSFEVLEYVLPKFEVQVKLPAHSVTSNPELKGHVTAKYANGKPVEGRVILTIKKLYHWWFFDPKAIQKQFQIDGEADFVIPIDALHRFDPHLDIDTLVVEAKVTESATGISDIGSKQVKFHKDVWKIEFFEGSPNYFQPGFKYTTYLKVYHPDGRPVVGTGDRVKIGLTYYTDKPSSVRSYYLPPSIATSALMTFLSPFPGGKVIFQPDMILPVPKDGMIKLTLDIPLEAATGRIDVEFKDQKLTKELQKFRTLSGDYLNLDMKNALLKVGDKAEFILTSNVKPGSKITYHIVRDRTILLTHYTTTSSQYRPNTVYETVTTDMAPTAKIVAYFLKDGELVADALEFSVDPVNFQNNVELKFEKTQVEPGSNVSLKLKADPNSRVNLLVVDRSVRLMKTGNDISHGMVKNKMGHVSVNEWFYHGHSLPRKRHIYPWIRTDDSEDVFEFASLKVLTDATVHTFSLSNVKANTEGLFEQDVNEVLDSRWFLRDIPHSHGRFSSWTNPPTKVRKEFPETWIWANVTLGATGYVDMFEVVPDSITTWEATAFALNEETGLGIVDVSANLTVYMPFYVTIQVPFSIVNGEVAVIQAVVFNYYPYDMYVTVTLMASNEDFVGTTVKYYNRQETEDKGNMTRCILVKSNDASSAYFNIRPVRNGRIDLEVHARSPRGSDAVVQSIIVKPQGLPEETNIPTLITMQPGQEFVKEIPIEYPKNVVADSQRLRIFLTGDMFGPSMDNIDALLVTPWGTGEQNMVNFAPVIYAANYLKSSGKLDDELQEKIRDLLTSGYQRQVKYQHWNGGFSAFNRHDEASVWLTAFVVKSFAQASDHIYIDPEVIKNAASFIIDKQTKDGSFNESGTVHAKSLQGSSASSARALTAYVLTALEELLDREIVPLGKNLTDTIQRANNYLNQELSRMTDDYELAITAYAFSLTKSPNAKTALSKLGSSSRIVSSTDVNENWKYWKSTEKEREIEINAFALLAYLEQGDKESGLPLVRWLVRQRNPHGGFMSTQDTVIALQALAKFAALTTSKDVSMTISIETPTKKLQPFILNSDNKDIVQFIDVPGSHENVKLTAVGTGTGLVEVASFYSSFGLLDQQNELMQLAVTTNSTNVNQFELVVCVRAKSPGNIGMVLLDIGPPSGYTLTTKASYYVPEHPLEEKAGDRLHLYLNSVTENATCTKVLAQRERIIGKVQPASIRAHSYYHPDKTATQWYLPDVLRNKTLCDVCGVECGCQFDPNGVPEERCKSGALIPAAPRVYGGTSSWRKGIETRTENGKPVIHIPPGTRWTVETTKVGQPNAPVGSSWSRRSRMNLGRPIIQSPAGSSWRRQTGIKTLPNIPEGSSWTRTTRIRAQPSLPVGSSWRRETKIRGLPTVDQSRGTNTWLSRNVVRKPTGSSTWQSSRNVWMSKPTK